MMINNPNLPPIPPNISRSIDLIVIHCAATFSGKPINTSNKTAVQVIDGWHLVRGFKRRDAARIAYNPELSAIGYHYVIDLDGSIQTGRGLDEIGAHAAGFNKASIGICLIGGQERVARYTSMQWLSLMSLTCALATRFKIPIAPPARLNDTFIKNGICGHRDLSPDLNQNGQIEPTEWTKTCPGFDVSLWLKRAMVPLDTQVIRSDGGKNV